MKSLAGPLGCYSKKHKVDGLTQQGEADRKNSGCVADTARAMTIQGTVSKTALLGVLALIATTWICCMYYTARDPASVVPWVGA